MKLHRGTLADILKGGSGYGDGFGDGFGFGFGYGFGGGYGHGYGNSLNAAGLEMLPTPQPQNPSPQHASYSRP